MLCPVTGNLIKLDYTGAVERASMLAIKKEMRLKILSELKHFKVRYLSRKTEQASKTYAKELCSYLKNIFSEHYPGQVNGQHDEADRKVEEEDEIEFATNWIRAFQKIYTELKWLNAFAIIN